MGLEYQPKNNLQFISTRTAQSRIRCSAACNQLSSCRTFDYDIVTKRCRLFEGDTTVGSIISSSSSTSFVGTVTVSSTLYSSIHNQSCQSCQQNRYESCSSNTTTCQCPPHTYWNGLVCALQLFQNKTCGQVDSCRSDLNLTCVTDCYGYSPACSLLDPIISSTMRFGTTVAGGCNGSTSTSQTVLSSPRDLLIFNNSMLLVADGTNQILTFPLNNRTGRIVKSFDDWVTHFVYDNKSSNFYGSVYNDHLIYIWPLNATIPPTGLQQGSCSLDKLFYPSGIVVDSSRNVYISSFSCHWVTKWAPNATIGTLVVGSPTATPGSDSQSLRNPSSLLLDEANSFLYVADRYNHRIQRFVLGSSGMGVTIAGDNGSGSAPNQLNLPSDIYLSGLDGSLYIADSYNHRIQKWGKNATYGNTVAGSLNGILGDSPYLMNVAIALAIDDQENYLYVSDYSNNRIQRFSLR